MGALLLIISLILVMMITVLTSENSKYDKDMKHRQEVSRRLQEYSLLLDSGKLTREESISKLREIEKYASSHG